MQDAVGSVFINFGKDAFLHHLVFEDGTIIDFFVQTTERDNFEHAICVLGCRDATLATRLDSFERPTPATPQVARANDVCQLIVDSWIISHKHRKVLARRLPVVAIVGIHQERMALIRLLYIAQTGRDMTDRPTIHGLTPAVRSLQDAIGPRLLELIGMPLRSEREIVAAILALQDELSRVGHELADQMGFEYPERLERTVREAWRRFRGE
jgi:hypothetical protein